MAKYRYRVDIYEYERGFGRRHEGVKFFDDEAKALNYVRDYNSRNTANYVPDCYWKAEGPERVQVA